jgi:protoporphyrinogen oxidase
MKKQKDALILGAGVTGLAAGRVSGLPIFEAEDRPGGISASYYVRPRSNVRLFSPPADGEAYRFETGGGHWIFGVDPSVRRFLGRRMVLRRYDRHSSVFFPEDASYVPFPLQSHLEFFGDKKKTILDEQGTGRKGVPRTMREWLKAKFGPTLCDIFFYGFHDLYTAGLYRHIAPQDTYKSPANGRGYNNIFWYPERGLDHLTRFLASGCDIRYRKKAVRIDAAKKKVFFSDGTALSYHKLISTIPLSKLCEITGIRANSKPDPYTSALVLNIGARRGDRCPDSHWVYLPKNDLGFYRIGFYSNVESSFLPRSARRNNSRVGIYIERAFLPGDKPTAREIDRYRKAVLHRLRAWGFIGATEAVCADWISVAYTWSRPGSRWRENTLKVLKSRGIDSIGRYGRWHFEGIADSIKEGLAAGEEAIKNERS